MGFQWKTHQSRSETKDRSRIFKDFVDQNFCFPYCRAMELNINEPMKKQVVWRLGQMIPANDVHMLMDAAVRPMDAQAMKRAEVVWGELSVETKVSLGNTLDDFVASQSHKIRSKANTKVVKQEVNGPETVRPWR